MNKDVLVVLESSAKTSTPGIDFKKQEQSSSPPIRVLTTPTSTVQYMHVMSIYAS